VYSVLMMVICVLAVKGAVSVECTDDGDVAC